MTDIDLRYPIGRWNYDGPSTREQRTAWIDAIARMPGHLRAATADLNQEQWDTPYRPDGWTLCQLVHHIADSHVNAYVRFKLALSEDNPTIKPYDQDAWSRLPDTPNTPAEVSLQLLGALHRRWVVLLRNLSDEDMQRTVFHPEADRTLTVDELLSLYAWHSRHHVAHVTALRSREGWGEAEPVLE